MDAHPNAFVARVVRSLVALRKRDGLTVLETAERLGTTVQNVQRIERGQNVTLKTLARFASAVGYEVEIRFKRHPRGPRTPVPGRAAKS